MLKMYPKLALLTVFALFCFVSKMDYLDQVKEEQHTKTVHKKADKLAQLQKMREAAEFNRLAAEAERMTGMKAGMK